MHKSLRLSYAYILIKFTKILYSWKFLRDKNFEVFGDFDLSSKIKALKKLMKILRSLVKVLVPQKFIHEKLKRGNKTSSSFVVSNII